MFAKPPSTPVARWSGALLRSALRRLTAPEAEPEGAEHPHRRAVGWRPARRPGEVAPRPQPCVSPVPQRRHGERAAAGRRG